MYWNMMQLYSTHAELTVQQFRITDHLDPSQRYIFYAVKVPLPSQNGNFQILVHFLLDF